MGKCHRHPRGEGRSCWIGPWMRCGTRDLTATTLRDTCLGCGTTFCFMTNGIPRRWGCRKSMRSWGAKHLPGRLAPRIGLRPDGPSSFFTKTCSIDAGRADGSMPQPNERGRKKHCHCRIVILCCARTFSALLQGSFLWTRCLMACWLPARLGQHRWFSLATLVDIRSSRAPHCLIRRLNR